MKYKSSEAGFTVIELAIVCAISMIALAMALPILNQTLRVYRASSDARNLSEQLAMARMLAAHKFTHTRLNMVGSNSYQIEVQTNAASCSAATWATDGGPHNLNRQVTFGLGSVAHPAPPQTGAAHQPPNSVVIFNSRGTPIDCSGAPVSDYAIYLQDANGEVYAVTVSPSSQTSVWKYARGNSSWNHI